MTKEAFTPTPVYAVSGIGPYAIEHPFATAADLIVQMRDGISTVTVQASEYTAENSGDRGTLTLSATAAASYDGWDMTILRSTAFEQGWEGQTSREVGLEAQLDLLTMAMQDTLQRTRGAAFRLPIGEETPDLPAAPDRVGMVAGFDANGNPALYGTTITENLFTVQRPYPTLADLIEATDLLVGQILRTAGYDRAGDGGAGWYEIVPGGTGTADGGAYIDLTGTAYQAKLLHGSVIHAEQFGVVLAADGQMQERSAQFNAAFRYAASLADTYDGDDAEDVTAIVTGGYEFACATDFMAKDTLDLMEGNSAARAMTINWSGHVVAVAGGTLETHTHERPIPLVHFRLRNCKVYWPRFECEMLCAGIKGKVDLANQHYNLELRGFHRYGLWIVANNDSTWWDFIIKQFVRHPEWIRNGVDTTDWTEWNADCFIVTTKDRRFYGGQVGWGGPAVRITDTMPDDADQRIPGQNCYWCGLSASQGYLDGDNGGGDVVFNDLHIMQGLSNDAFPDAGIEPRYGVYADYDFATGGMVFREVDSTIGVLSFCKVANLSKFSQIDNDHCTHLLFGAQIEMEGELTGSQAAPVSASLATGTLLDPRIRVFASRGANGGQRYPFMSSMVHQRQMSISFERDIWTHQTAFTAGTLIDGHAFKATHAAALADVAGSYANMRVVTSTGLTGSSVHYDGTGLVGLGENHAAAALPQLQRAPSTAPVVLLGLGQSNLLGHAATASDGDHTIASGVYIWNSGLADGPGSAFIPAEFGALPLNRGSDPWANNLLIHAANDIKAATGRDVYIIMLGKGARNIESFLPSSVNIANGWTADEDLSWLYDEANAALALVPGREAIAPDVIVWQQGEANDGDSQSDYADKLDELIKACESEGLFRPAIEWNGDFDEWNRLNRASGSYAGQVQYRGRRATAGAWSPSVNEAGDYWVIHEAVTVNPGAVAANDGQILYALTDVPASAGDWLVVDADSAPVRQPQRWAMNVLADQYNLWPAPYTSGYAQINNHSGDEVFTTKTVVDGATATEELDGGNGTLTFTAPTVRMTGEGASGWDATGDGSLRPEVDGTQDLGDLTHWVRAVFDATGDKRPDHYGENDEPGVTGMAIPVLDWLAALTDRNYSLGSTTRTHPDIRSPVTLDISGDGAPMYRIRDVDDVTLSPRNVAYTGTAFAVIVNGASNGLRINRGFILTDAFALTIKPSQSTGGWAENGVISDLLLEGSASTAKTAQSFDGDSRNFAVYGMIVKNFQRSGDSGDALAFAVSGDENDIPVNDSENIVYSLNVVEDVAGPMFHSEDDTRRIAYTFSVGRNVHRAVQIINNYVPYLHNYIGLMVAGPSKEFFRSTGTGSSRDMNVAFNLWDGDGVTGTEDYAVRVGQVATKNINHIGNIYHNISQAIGAYYSNAEGPLNFFAEVFDTIVGPCITLDADAVQATIGNCIFNGGTYGIVGASTGRTMPSTRRGILVQSTNRFKGVATDIIQKSQSANVIGDKAISSPVLDSQTASDTLLFVATRKGWLTGVTLAFPEAGGAGTTASTFTIYKTNSGGSTKLIDATVTKTAGQYDLEFWGSEHAQIEVNKFSAGDIIRVVCDGAEDAQTLFQLTLDWFEYDN